MAFTGDFQFIVINIIYVIYLLQSFLLSAHMRRLFCSDTLTEGEKKLSKILREKFPAASHVKVEDISGMMPKSHHIRAIS